MELGQLLRRLGMLARKRIMKILQRGNGDMEALLSFSVARFCRKCIMPSALDILSPMSHISLVTRPSGSISYLEHVVRRTESDSGRSPRMNRINRIDAINPERKEIECNAMRYEVY